MRHPLSSIAVATVALIASACNDSPVATLPPTSPALSASVATERTFIEDTRVVIGPQGCTGEPIQLTFKQVLSSQVVIDGRGGIHAEYHISNVENSDAIGVVTGTRYQWVEVQNGTERADFDGFPATTTARLVRRFIGQGSTPNLVFNITYHITFNANGEVTAYIDDALRVCH